MHVKRIHEMVECLTEKALQELNRGAETVDTEEFSKVIDSIKDLSEAEYYAKISKAMEESEEESRRYYDEWRYKDGRFAPKGHGRRGYEERWDMTPELYRDMDMNDGRMYTPRKHYTEECQYEKAMKKYKETRSKHNGGTQEDIDAKLRELESYMGELAHDVVGLIGDMTPEERTMTKAKLSTLVAKI